MNPWGTTYHQEVVKQEDFSLMQSEFLGLIWVWNLEESAVADQPPVRQREDLWGGGKCVLSSLPRLWSTESSLNVRSPALGPVFQTPFLTDYAA